MNNQPQAVSLEVPPCIGYERAQLLVRLLVTCCFYAVHQSLGGLFGALYVLLPITAAILISQHTSTGYVERDGPRLVSILEWVIGLYAYMMFVTDRFPLGPSERSVRLNASPTGSPALADALGRLVTSLPHAVLLALFSVVSALVSLWMALSVLLTQSAPESLRQFQLGLLGWLARVFVYHGSLVNAYPPFSFGKALAPPSPPHSEAPGGSSA